MIILKKNILETGLSPLQLSSNYSFLILFEDYYNRNNIQSFYSEQDSSVRGSHQVYVMLYFK